MIKILKYGGLGLSLVLIFGMNFWFMQDWLRGMGPADLGSIEVSYVSMGRFLLSNFPKLSFAPYWYLGFPFHLFYTPLLPFLEAVLSWWQGISLWSVYRLITGLAYCLAPVSLGLLAWGLTGRVVAALVAGLGYSFWPTILYFVLSSREVVRDMISGEGVLDPRRLVILARWGEGPHTLALVFLPLAGWFFWRFCKERKITDFVLTAVLTVLTALTNAVGLSGLALLLLATFGAYWMKPVGKRAFADLWWPSFWLVLATYGLLAFWYNFSFIGSFFGEGSGVLGVYWSLFPWGWVLGLVFFVLAFFLGRSFIKNRALLASLAWFLITFLVVGVYYFSAPPEFANRRLELLPQALRLGVEMDMAVALLAAVLLSAVLDYLRKKRRWLLLGGWVFTLALVLVSFWWSVNYWPSGRKIAGQEVGLEKTSEKRVADWFLEKGNLQPGERVFLSGNHGFYLNYFSDVWQVRGALYQAATHPFAEHMYYQVTHTEDLEISLAWLRIFNVRYLVVPGSDSVEIYKDFANPAVFESLAGLQKVAVLKGDIIYEVTGRQGIAKAVVLSEMKKLTTPKAGDDKKALAIYSDWLSKGKEWSFEPVNNDEYLLKGAVVAGEGVWVGMTFDKGFKARSDQGSFKIKEDPLGFMVLTTSESFEGEIRLVHEGRGVIWLGYLITGGTILVLSFCLVKGGLKWRKKPTQK